MKKINLKSKKLKKISKRSKLRKNPCDYEKADKELEQEFKILKKQRYSRELCQFGFNIRVDKIGFLIKLDVYPTFWNLFVSENVKNCYPVLKIIIDSFNIVIFAKILGCEWVNESNKDRINEWLINHNNELYLGEDYKDIYLELKKQLEENNLRKNPEQDFEIQLENLVRKFVEVENKNMIFSGILRYESIGSPNSGRSNGRFEVKNVNSNSRISFFPEDVLKIEYPDGYVKGRTNFGKIVRIILN